MFSYSLGLTSRKRPYMSFKLLLWGEKAEQICLDHYFPRLKTALTPLLLYYATYLEHE